MSDAALKHVLGQPWRKPKFVKSDWLRRFIYVGAIAYFIAALTTIEVDWGRVYEGLDRGKQFVLAFTNPDFGSRASDIWDGLVESIVMKDTIERKNKKIIKRNIFFIIYF